VDDSVFRRRYGPWALVAGASVGMGEQFSRQVAAKGLNLVLVARRAGPLEDLAAELRRSHGIEVRTVTADLAAADLWEVLEPQISDIDVGLLICNAATYAIGEFLDGELDSKLAELDLNCRSPLILTHQLGRLMAERGRGGIVIVSSMSGLQGSAMVSSYAASKAYDMVLAEGLWEELRHRGVDVLAMVAGSTRTPNFVEKTPRPATGLAAPMDPAQVVRQALESIDKGPTRYAGPVNTAGAFFMQRLLPRRKAVEFISNTTRKIYGKDESAEPSRPAGAGSASGGWDDEYDVVVVGYGGAGSAAALEAASAGARVLVADRFGGGGATKLCAGIYYAGGGTKQQRLAGFADTPEAMEAYLRTEVGDAVDPETLHAFCQRSLENYEWLQAHGVGFPDLFHEAKTTTPPDEYGLYYSGNELQRADAAPPAARGHRVAGVGLTGKDMYRSLSEAVAASGATVWTHAGATRLITDESGGVAGVELRVIDDASLQLRHNVLAQAAAGVAQTRTAAADRARAALVSFEERHGRTVRVRARGGVVLCTGGFVFSRELMDRYGGAYADTMPLGTVGDDGAALRLGGQVGAASGKLDRYAASRFICPPDAFVCGVLVNPAGERVCDETLYGSTLSANIVESGGGKGYLVIDHALWQRAKVEMKAEDRLRDKPPWRVLTGQENHLVFRKGTAWLNRWVNRKKADSLPELARRSGIDPRGLEATVERYNADAAGGGRDSEGKDPKYVRPLTTPPYYAIDVSLASKIFPSPCLTLGGLAVEGLTGAVRSSSGGTVPGLYAAGRAAVGISSHSYVSGLSTADGIFSGRNAGAAAAARAATALSSESGAG